ncbi:MAG: sulfite exporter TauE/SafE family protein [Anaerolineales bacterium]
MNHIHLGGARVLRPLAFVLALLILLSPAAAYAHPADMYSQNQSIAVRSDALQIVWQILPGPFLADAVWAAADTNQDGLISPSESEAWITPFVESLSVRLDNVPLANGGPTDVHWPATVDVLRTAEDRIEFTLGFAWPAGLKGRHTLEVHSAHLEANSLNWFGMKAAAGMSFSQPNQSNGLLRTQVDFTAGAAGAGAPAGMTSWNSGTPNLPAFGAAVTQFSAQLTNSAASSAPVALTASTVTSTLTNLVKAGELSPWFLAGAFLLSVVLGSLHALTPGHGKALVGAYLVGSHGTTRDAIFLGSIVTLTHTGSVVLLGLATLLASHYMLPALIAPWLEIISGVLVVGFGLSLLVRRRSTLAGWLGGARTHSRYDLPGTERSHHHQHQYSDHAGADSHGEDLDHHRHAHADSGRHVHGHTHALPEQQVSAKSLLALGVSGGLVPCPDAIAILLVAVAVNRVPFGILLILSFSIGLALVLIGIGIAMVNGLRFITRSDLLSRFTAYTPILSAVVVTGLGVALTVSAFNSLRFGSSVVDAATTQSAAISTNGTRTASVGGFDLEHARLLYVASDSHGWDQLFMRPLGESRSVQYTDESTGITGYSIAPNGKTILYTLFESGGGTAIWALNSDGTGRRLLLDCPASECDAPRWYADSRKIVYERLDDATDSTVPRFSIWWLDAETGKTQPVFQDPSFASYAPQFSPDGRWLSYVSTANNNLILYDLQDGASTTLPLGLQASLPATWSPDAQSILFASQADAGTGLRTRMYSLKSRQTTDLGGPAGASDYAAAWAPDATWIAIDRNVPLDAAHSGNQVWLIKTDGSQSRVLLDEAGASYSSLKWSPDGRYLLYSRYALDPGGQNPGRFDIYLADIQTGESQLLVNSGDLPTFLP